MSPSPGNRSIFVTFSQHIAMWMGRPAAFLLALAAIVLWAVSGPVFNYSETWQLIINTGTTIITFLMVFLIQNTQNRDTAALQLKLDELIRVTDKARNTFLDLEELEEEDLQKIRNKYEKMAADARSNGEGMSDDL